MINKVCHGTVDTKTLPRRLDVVHHNMVARLSHAAIQLLRRNTALDGPLYTCSLTCSADVCVGCLLVALTQNSRNMLVSLSSAVAQFFRREDRLGRECLRSSTLHELSNVLFGRLLPENPDDAHARLFSSALC